MIFYLRLPWMEQREEERHASFIPGKLASVKMRRLINIYNEPVLMPPGPPSNFPFTRPGECSSLGYVATPPPNDKASPF